MGCTSYRVYQATDNEDEFAIIEEWEENEQLAHAHLVSATYRDLAIMDIKTAALQFKKKFNERSATLFLTLLLWVDLSYVVLHFVYTFANLSGKHSLSKDGGYAEMFQYAKWLWIIILLGYISKIRRSFRYVTWAGVFTFLLLDDALKLHEKVGNYIAGYFDFPSLSNIELYAVGQFVYSALAGIIMLCLVTLAYVKGEQVFKKVSQDILLLVLILVFFGVGVDLLHTFMELGRGVSFILVVVEDGGEMVATSLILWYVFLIAIRDESKSYYICDCIWMSFRVE